MPMRSRIFMIALCLLAFGVSAAEGLHESKPFAEKHLILQVSSSDQHHSALNIANNLIKYYGGPDLIDIQVVTFAAGIDLLRREDNPHQKRIESLQANGVRFLFCQNTVDTLARDRGIEFKSLTGVHPVRSGVAHILGEVERGYTLVAP